MEATAGPETLTSYPEPQNPEIRIPVPGLQVVIVGEDGKACSHFAVFETKDQIPGAELAVGMMVVSDDHLVKLLERVETTTPETEELIRGKIGVNPGILNLEEAEILPLAGNLKRTLLLLPVKGLRGQLWAISGQIERHVREKQAAGPEANGGKPRKQSRLLQGLRPLAAASAIVGTAALVASAAPQVIEKSNIFNQFPQLRQVSQIVVGPEGKVTGAHFADGSFLSFEARAEGPEGEQGFTEEEKRERKKLFEKGSLVSIDALNKTVYIGLKNGVMVRSSSGEEIGYYSPTSLLVWGIKKLEDGGPLYLINDPGNEKQFFVDSGEVFDELAGLEYLTLDKVKEFFITGAPLVSDGGRKQEESQGEESVSSVTISSEDQHEQGDGKSPTAAKDTIHRSPTARIPVAEWQDWLNSQSADALLERATGGYEGKASWDELITELTEKKLILVGENHADTESQRNVLKIIKEVYERNPMVVVALERFCSDHQEILDEFIFSNRFASEQEALDYLLKETRFSERGWVNYGDEETKETYFSILLFTRENKVPLKGLDLPEREQDEIFYGSLLETDRDERQVIGYKSAEQALTKAREAEWGRVLSQTAGQIIVVTGNEHVSSGEDSLYGVLSEDFSVISVAQPSIFDSIYPWKKRVVPKEGVLIIKNPNYSGHHEEVDWSDQEHPAWTPRWIRGRLDYLLITQDRDNK